jgi:flavin reductase (DIM6/NTAB) family NADH-FMN oxidoreductase RutF
VVNVRQSLGGYLLVEDQTRIYRRLFGRFVTGVAVVLTEEDGEVKGITVNSLTSASLNPLLLLFCVRNESASGDAILRVQRFTVNILGAHQEHAACHFAGRKDPQSSLAFARDDGFVWLEDSNAVFRCDVAGSYPGGDHRIILGRVVDMLGPEACSQLLVYHSGDYAHLAPVSRTKESSPA